MSKPAAPPPTASQAEAVDELTPAEIAEIENYNQSWRDAVRYGAGWEVPATERR